MPRALIRELLSAVLRAGNRVNIGYQRGALERFAPSVERHAPEVGWNGAVLHRELAGLGFTSGYLQAQRFLRTHREQRKWSE
jgi:ubiquinone biosynthesis protein COQ9